MKLGCFLNDVRIGTLERRAQGRTSFRFEEAYFDLPRRPVLGRWFEDRLSPDLELIEQGSRLMPFFQNVLPEVGSALRTYVAEEYGLRARDDLGLLAVLGEDLPGALIVRDESRGPNLPTDEPAPPSPRRVEEGAVLRFSLAGLQLKYSMLLHGKRFRMPMKGQGGRWIVKMPDPKFPNVPRVEHAMLECARRVGIQVPEARLVPIGDLPVPSIQDVEETTALAVKRFDRDDLGGRIHQEDFAQVLAVRPEGDNKYQGSYVTLARLIRTLCGEDDYEEFVRRLVFAIVTGNADAHLKNWSLVYPDGIRPRLSPAYDLVCVVAYLEGASKLALNFGGEKRFDRLRKTSFVELARKAGADPDRTIAIVDETIRAARREIDSVAPELPISKAGKKRLEKHLVALDL